MYGLPADFNGREFIGRCVELLCFSVNTVSIEFSDDASVTILGAFVYRALDCDDVRQTPPLASSTVMRIIGHQVLAASARADGTLTLTFDNGDVLECLDDSSQYESYSISIGGRELII